MQHVRVVWKNRLGREVEDWVFKRTRSWRSVSEAWGRRPIARQAHGGEGAASATWLVPQSTQGVIQKIQIYISTNIGQWFMRAMATMPFAESTVKRLASRSMGAFPIGVSGSMA